MNKTIKKQWLDALRSGDYPQGRIVLHIRDDGYCCMGVLCDLHAKATGADWGEEKLIPGGGTALTYDGGIYYLPASVVEWAGLNSINPVVADWPLSNHNDGTSGVNRKNFNQIADLIEQEL